MQKLIKRLAGLTTSTAIALTGIVMLHKQAVAQSYDIDCKVILCLAGGFPSGCSDAFDYMIDRITSFPPKPPFGICTGSDGVDYDRHNTNFQFLSGRNSYFCEEGSQLFYGQDQEFGFEEAFCYSSTTVGFSFEGQEDIIYHGVSRPTRLNYRIQITVEPNGETEFVSPTFVGNFNGFFKEI